MTVVGTGSLATLAASTPASGDEQAVVVAIISGSVTLTVAILGALATYLASKREQRRRTYSEAVRAATAWKELLYRVRRRQDDEAASIIDRFHQAQDNLSYYEAWVGAESKFMARSYKRLVSSVKDQTDDLIREAWAQGVRPVTGATLPADVHPDIHAAVATFLDDVRCHLSPWPWRKLAMVWRNRGVA